MKSPIRLFWRVHMNGYKIAQRETPAVPLLYGEGVRDCIVPIIVPLEGKNKTRWYEAELLEYEIFRDLGNSARRPGPAGALEFVEKWGLLKDGPIESLEHFLKCRDDFLCLMSGKISLGLANELEGLRGYKRELGVGFGPLDIRLERKGPRIFFEARSLLQFCVLEFFQTAAGGIALTTCDACGKFLPLHKQGRPKRYCDDACKSAAWRAKHGEAMNRRRRQNRAKRRAA